MVWRYRDKVDQNALKTHICERVKALGGLAAVCREAGMPHIETVRLWAKDDVSFAETLKDARRRGWFRLKWAFDEAKARRVLGHLRAGGSIHDMPTGAEWPPLRMVRYWRAIDGEFGAEVVRLQTVLRGNRGRPFGRASVAFDRATADRVILAVARGGRVDLLHRSDPTLPGMRVIDRWRREDEEFAIGLGVAMKVRRAKVRREPAMLTPELKQTIIDRIREGGSLASLSREAGMPGGTTLYGWVRRSPEFAKDVAQACEDREDWWADQVGMAMDDAPGASAAVLRARLAPVMKGWQRHQNRPGKRWR